MSFFLPKIWSVAVKQTWDAKEVGWEQPGATLKIKVLSLILAILMPQEEVENLNAKQNVITENLGLSTLARPLQSKLRKFLKLNQTSSTMDQLKLDSLCTKIS